MLHCECLRLAKQLESVRAIQGPVGAVQHPVERRASPVGMVVAAGRAQDLEERVGIRVVPDPSEPGELKLVRLELLQVDFPLLVLDPDLDPEVLLPHLLDRLRDLLVGFGGVVSIRDGRQRVSRTVPRLGERRPCRLGVEQLSPKASISPDATGDHIAGRDLPAAGNVFHEALPIDRKRKGLAHQGVVERRRTRVHPQEIGGQVVRAAEVLEPLQMVHELRRQGSFSNVVQLACLVEIQHGVVALHHGQPDLANAHVLGVPVTRVLLEHDVLPKRPFGQPVGAVADDVLGSRPQRLRSALRLQTLEQMPRQGHGGVEADDAEEVRQRIGERHFEDVIGQRLDPHHRHVGHRHADGPARERAPL